jgi:hypothetical protein
MQNKVSCDLEIMRDNCQPSGAIVILCSIPEIFSVALMHAALAEIGVKSVGQPVDSHLCRVSDDGQPLGELLKEVWGEPVRPLPDVHFHIDATNLCFKSYT